MSKKDKKRRKKRSEDVGAPEDSVKAEVAASAPGAPVETADAGLSAKAAKLARKAAKEGKREKERKTQAAPPDDGASAFEFKHVRRKRLSSGKGPSPAEIGRSLVSLFNAGKSDEAESTWYHRKIESIEDDGRVFEGMKGVLEKGNWWKENVTVLSMRASALYVCSTGFTVVYSGRVRMADGTEIDGNECGVYTVEDGRIVREQFMKWSGAK